jgi:hypothetical protein
VSAALPGSASTSASAPPPAPAASAVAEAPSAARVGSEAEVVLDRYLGEPSDGAKHEAVKHVLRGMCVPPGRRDLQGIVAAHLASGEPPEDASNAAWLRRRSALLLLKPCLDAHLDGPYVDLVVNYHRAELAHRNGEAILALDSLVGLRPALRPELERWARLHAPLAASSNDCHALNGVAWSVLLRFGVLREGMPFAEAVTVLGPGGEVARPTGEHVWYVTTPCHVNPQLTIETRGDLVQQIRIGAS